MLVDTNARSPAPGRAARDSVETPASSWAYASSDRSDMRMRSDRASRAAGSKPSLDRAEFDVTHNY
jgi:hypothetical protein